MTPGKRKLTVRTAEASLEPESSEKRTPNYLKSKAKISRKSQNQGTLQIQKQKNKNTAEVSSAPVSSENITQNSLKPKPKIRKSLNKGTLQVQDKRIKKKKFVLGSKFSSHNEKEDAKDRNARELKEKSTVGGEHDKKNQEITKIQVKGAGQNEQQNELSQTNEEKHGALQKKQHHEKIKEKSLWFKKVEDCQMDQEKHGKFESQRNEKKKEKLGGLIFMCNTKTKPDCFRYSVMGVTMNKKELVLGLEPGLKLFLYDFDLRLLYGIYKASSSGGMKLEPAAFGGAFPVQVRFNVDQDCYPLPESVFRRAIKENYNESHKFNTELTVQQVKKLVELFRPAEVLSHAPLIGPSPMAATHGMEVNEEARVSLAHQHRDPLARDPHTNDEGRRYHVLYTEDGHHLTHRKGPSTLRGDFSQNYFPSESEYRTYGLRGDRQNFTPPRNQIAPTLEPHLGYIYKDAPVQGLATRLDTHAVPVQYHTSGHFPIPELQSSNPLVTTTTASTIDSYSKVPYSTYQYGGSLPNPYQPASGREQVPLGFYSFSGRGETYPSETGHLQRRETYLTETNHLGRREVGDAGMSYSTYASDALSEYNQIHKHQGAGPQSSFAPVSSFASVSSRYSFAGPSVSRR